MGEVSGTKFLYKQTFGPVETKEAGKERLVSTYRPIEMMFAATGKNPKDFSGKDVLNVGAGETH